MTLFRGLSAFPITPMDPTGRVGTDALGRLLDRIADAGADSIGLLGSTGSYAYLSLEERERAVDAALNRVGGRIPVIVGVGALRTDHAQRLARQAKAAGADGLILAPMSYTPLTQDEVHHHAVAVADAGDLPLCLYNNPGTTHFTFGEPLIGRLAQHPGIAAIKMPLPGDGDIAGELARLRALVPADFSIGYSGDWGAADALLAGCDAWYSVVGGLLPRPALMLTRAAQAGDTAAARAVDAAFAPLWSLFKAFSSYRVMHAIAEIGQLAAAEPPRPILPLDAAAKVQVAEALEQLSLAAKEPA